MELVDIARQVLGKYPNGIKVYQLQEEAKYFNVEATDILREICNICSIEED